MTPSMDGRWCLDRCIALAAMKLNHTGEYASDYRWRVSPDVRRAIVDHVGVGAPIPGLNERLFGIILDTDDALPEGTIELERADR